MGIPLRRPNALAPNTHGEQSHQHLSMLYNYNIMIESGGCHKDGMVVRVPFHARTLHILIMADLFYRDLRRARSLGRVMENA